jgi:transposase
MKEVITIGVDLAKNVFQVHGIDTEGAVVLCRQFLGPAQAGRDISTTNPCYSKVGTDVRK